MATAPPVSPVAPTPPTTPPNPPINRGDRDTFADRVDATISYLTGAPAEIYGLAQASYNNAQAAVQALDNIDSQVQAAASAAVDDALGVLALQKSTDTIPASPPQSPSTKMFRLLTTNTAQIVTRGASYKGYRLMNLLKGLASTTSSLGAPADLWRVGKVWQLHAAYVVKQAGIVTTGAWVDDTITGTTLGHTPGSAATSRFLTVKRNTVVGDYLEQPVTVGRSGVLSLGFMMTAGAANVVEILLNGTLRETISTRNANGPFIYRHRISVAPGDYTVRIRIGTGSTGTLYSIGGNFFPVDEAPLDAQVDQFYFYNSDQDYIDNEGASDYALVDASNSNLYSGSYHGGETSQSVTWLANGAAFTPAANALVLSGGFELRQSTTIAGKITSVTAQRFVADGTHEFNAVLHGAMNATTVYTGMSGTAEVFSRIAFPRVVDMASLADGTEVELGRPPLVVQERPDTGQRLSIYITIFALDTANKRGGVFVRHAVGAYNKLYYGPAVSATTPYVLNDLAWRQVRVFD
jgi:hypothetical protein